MKSFGFSSIANGNFFHVIQISTKIINAYAWKCIGSIIYPEVQYHHKQGSRELKTRRLIF
jgi:hypothetical protein